MFVTMLSCSQSLNNPSCVRSLNSSLSLLIKDWRMRISQAQAGHQDTEGGSLFGMNVLKRAIISMDI